MKLWPLGLALLFASISVWAGNYRIVQSPSQKLDVWIDNVKSNAPQSWCSSELSLRIVANGEASPQVLKTFMPRLGALLENQCNNIERVSWQLENAQNMPLAHGSAAKNSDWEVTIDSPLSSVATSNEKPEDISSPLNRTPWLEFTLQGGCHLRTYWQGNAGSSALFIPAKDNGKCENGGWLNGTSEVIQVGSNGEKRVTLSFVHGFPVSGLNPSLDASSLLIASVNNERMVVSNEQAPQSWLILPYNPELNAWQASGTVAVEVSRDMALDEPRLQAKLNEVRKRWSDWLPPDATITLLLVESLHLQLSDPAAGAWRAQK